MATEVFPELTSLRTLVKRAKLVAETQHTILWCLDQLPKLYADFCRTYESRFGDAILRLAQGMLDKLRETCPGRVGDALVAKLGGLHGRLGLAPLAFKVGVRKKRPA